MDETERVVKAGTWLYNGEVLCDVRIVFTRFRWGSGDYEDPPEYRDDQMRDTYHIMYGSTMERGKFGPVGYGRCDTLEEAVREVEATVSGVRWSDEPEPPGPRPR
jgi:hypothetical protein